MDVTGNNSQPGGLYQNDDENIKVLVLYEDFSAGQRAIALFNRVAEHPANPAPLDVVMWKYSLLSVPALQAMATEDAVAADMIVVAGHEAHELPAAFQRWIDLWLIENVKGPRTLISLLERGFEPSGSEPAIRSFLRRVARMGRMEFIDQHEPHNSPENGEDIEGTDATQPDAGISGLGSWLREQSRPEWN